MIMKRIDTGKTYEEGQVIPMPHLPAGDYTIKKIFFRLSKRKKNYGLWFMRGTHENCQNIKQTVRYIGDIDNVEVV